jgi:hypothetical protein
MRLHEAVSELEVLLDSSLGTPECRANRDKLLRVFVSENTSLNEYASEKIGNVRSYFDEYWKSLRKGSADQAHWKNAARQAIALLANVVGEDGSLKVLQ